MSTAVDISVLRVNPYAAELCVSISRYLKPELLAQIPASNNNKIVCL